MSGEPVRRAPRPRGRHRLRGHRRSAPRARPSARPCSTPGWPATRRSSPIPRTRARSSTMTSPQQGNYGMNDEDPESGARAGGRASPCARPRGARRQLARRAHARRRARAAPASSASRASTRGALTRAAARRAARCAAASPPSTWTRRRSSSASAPPRDGGRRPRAHRQHGRAVRGGGRWSGRPTPTRGRVFRVAAYDFGMKREHPAPARGVRDASDRVPGRDAGGRRSRPAATTACSCPTARATRPRPTYGIAATRELLGKVPIFGICLGHQLLGARARRPDLQDEVRAPRREPAGAATSRPGTVEITSHNHGFAVDPTAWERDADGSPRPTAGAWRSLTGT